MKNEIRIFPIRSRSETWRATMLVPQRWALLPGVRGQQSENGPWIGGDGNSPSSALDALIVVIGRAALGALYEETPEETP